MAAPRKYGDDVRTAIDVLINEEHQSASQAHASLTEQFGESPSIDRIRDIAKEAALQGRPAIAKQSKHAQLSRLVEGIVTVADTEIARMQREKGAIDADQLLKLANTVKTLEPLLKPEPQKDTGNKPASFLSALPEAQHTDESDTHKRNSEARSADRPLSTSRAA